MRCLRNHPILFILILFHMNLYSDEQLIGEEKKYVFLEQALLERVRSTLLDMTKSLEERMEHLEQKLNSANLPKGPLNGCPASDNCAVEGLEYFNDVIIEHVLTSTRAFYARQTCESDEQLIGEEKKYVFLEQALLERVRSTLLDMTKSLEERMEHLEQKLNSANLPKGPLNGCPASDNCAVEGLECPRFFIDPATLFKSFLSRDRLTLTNRRPDNFYNWPAVSGRKYKGARGTTLITNKQKMYFETDIYYRLEKDLTKNNIVFEVAFATENAIGNSFYVGGQKGAWSIFAYNSTNGVTLCSQHNGGNITTLKILSNATSGTEIYLTLGFYINRVDNTIAVFDINMNRKIVTFTDVDGSQVLWPVFGVYSPTNQLVRLQLNSEKDITSAPCGLF